MTFESDRKKRHRLGHRVMLAGCLIMLCSWALMPPRKRQTLFDPGRGSTDLQQTDYEGRMYAGIAIGLGGIVFSIGSLFRMDRT